MMRYSTHIGAHVLKLPQKMFNVIPRAEDLISLYGIESLYPKPTGREEVRTGKKTEVSFQKIQLNNYLISECAVWFSLLCCGFSFFDYGILTSMGYSLPRPSFKKTVSKLGDPKDPFSIVTTPRCRGWCYSFPWMAPLCPWYVPYNAES